MSELYNLHPKEEHEDKSFGYQLDSEIEARKEPVQDLPGGVRYVADTRRTSQDHVSQDGTKGEHERRASFGDVLEDTRCDIRTRGYLPIENYGFIGNLRTVALAGTDGSIDFFCYPKFDSPSIFCRLLDKDKGGHFSITPKMYTSNKQQYLPNSNILTTRFMSNDGVAEITDYMHIPEKNQRLTKKPLLPWVIRSVRVIRGTVDFKMECYPSFNYGQSSHTAQVVSHDAKPMAEHINQDARFDDDGEVCQSETKTESSPQSVVFIPDDPGFQSCCSNEPDNKPSFDLRFLTKCGDYECPLIKLHLDEDASELGFKGPGVVSKFTLEESQEVTFVFREIPPVAIPDSDTQLEAGRPAYDPILSGNLIDALFRQTAKYWQGWVASSTYNGRWREHVMRSALTLKLLTYEPTGAVVAAPTFGLPEAIGGSRNWDYRYVWIRDSSFTIYAFLRLGFTEEARKYLEFIEERCNDLNEDGSLNIMYSIDGTKELDEYELDHFEGYRSSRPVRVGNGAYGHLQLDIYGELMDGIYLYNKYGSPVSYDIWCIVRKLANYVVDHWKLPDMSIWEVRASKQRFTYSMIMCWVALDRAIRLAMKRQFPCFERDTWTNTRDTIYETIQNLCYNKKLKMYSQSIETPDALDASCLIMPLVFFSSPTDPRMLNTIQRMLLPPEKGGLVTNDLVFRYNFLTTDDGVGGEEGAFSMCTFWLVEALARAGRFDRKLLLRASVMFERMLSYGNHLGLFSEEVARSGELLGNFPQAFTHIAFISAAYNLDRALH
ncbi:Six-hairpin glycosidase-like protein [Halteromyces radiatus]|uniref:Six-hairpin glycosidase-like protein n=1 Tax=Halteromyces radiatus TaxID=101107 RepID=UPI00221EAB97|nr:Six-hairpin glycosidase-like protein [Halteromyces radiatus]KAI8079727.1 Six-hairpin glycosidase-like protein [Halteromyces radiatus]